jgi:UDP-3-O-[3-hydroxymyristoyl] glucosamine N-acyltransferase
MAHTVRDIADAVGGRAEGDLSLAVTGAAEPAAAGPDRIAVAMAEKYLVDIGKGRARVAMVPEGTDWQSLGLSAAVLIARPRLALAGLTALLDAGVGIAPGLHATAVIEDGAHLGEDVRIGPFVHVGSGAVIGAGSRLMSHVTVAAGSVIGPGALLHAGVRIGRNVRIGARFVAHQNAVVGGDGFSFVTPEKSGIEAVRETLGDRADTKAQAWLRIHSLGGVEIGDDVELGSNAAIDAGTIRATRVGNGTKIDNLVTVGHNVSIGRDCLLCGQVGIAGSSRIGDRVTLGGQVGVSDNIFVGDDVIAGGATKIYTSVPAGRVILGAPAMKMEANIEAWKNIRRLGRFFDEVRSLRRIVAGGMEAGKDAAKDAGKDGEDGA